MYTKLLFFLSLSLCELLGAIFLGCNVSCEIYKKLKNNIFSSDVHQ